MTTQIAIENLLNDFASRIQLKNTQIMAKIREAQRLGDTAQLKENLWTLADQEDKGFEETVLSERIRDLAEII